MPSCETALLEVLVLSVSSKRLLNNIFAIFVFMKNVEDVSMLACTFFWDEEGEGVVCFPVVCCCSFSILRTGGPPTTRAIENLAWV